ncbi:MAG: 30S ribosomal protein S16 [Sedimentisphaerales bacterium]|nr:30S ribosomal protein S16 [Sedimentisphaerales bacterium]
MAVKIRMARIGRRHRPFFRINAIESRAPRDGRILEKLGHYDPIEKDPAKQVVLNRERVQYWLDKGAIPSDTISQILLRQGIKHKYAEQKAVKMARARAAAHAKGRLFTETEKIAAQKAAETQAKAEEEAKTKAEKEAKAKEEAKAKAETQAKAEEEAKAKTEKEAKAEAKAEDKAEKTQVSEEKEKPAEEKQQNEKADEN